MASSAKNIQLRELKDKILQLNTMVSEQTELIKSLRLMIDEKSSREKALQEQVDYLTQKLFGPSSERRSDDIPGQQNLFDKAEIEQDPSLLEEETMIREHTRKKKAAHDDLFKGLRVEKVVIPLPEEEQVCPVCGTQMVLIGEEYVRRELEFVPATCKVIEYYSQSYGCPSCKEGLGDTEKPEIIKSQVPGGPDWERPCLGIHCCVDDVPEVRQWASPLPPGKGLETVWRPDQLDHPCQLDHLLLTELFPADV